MWSKGGVSAGNFLAWSRLALLGTLTTIGIALCGCGTRPSSAVLIPIPSPIRGDKAVTVLVATTRDRSKDNLGTFTEARARNISYEEYLISVPPNHRPGQVEWPAQIPGNPQKDFVVTSERSLGDTDFAAAIANRMDLKRNKAGKVLVFVHGYNTNYQEAVFRLAQLAADIRYAEPMVLFTWPSRGTLTGYEADRESATYSRDYLERVLNQIAHIPNVRKITLVAHSMGNWLAVEALRQAKFRESSAFLGKLGEVVLLAPDIDVDVFRTQLDAIGKLKYPIIIALSKNDLALAASQRIAGDVSRVGNFLIDNPEARAAIEKYGLKVVDLSRVTGTDYVGHSGYLQALPELQDIAAANEATEEHGVRAAGLFVVNGAGKILRAPLEFGGNLLER
jgi:esterase/lipase superfamily enzyme